MQSTRRDPLDANSGHALCFSGEKQGLVGKRQGRPLSSLECCTGHNGGASGGGKRGARGHFRTEAQRRSSSPIAAGCRGLG